MLLHQPKLLILDEPTNALDPLMWLRLFDVLKELNTQGTTIFFSSHILSEVQKIYNKVSFIRRGGLINAPRLANFKSTDIKKVTIKLKNRDLLELIRRLEIENLKTDNDKLSFIYNSDINVLIKTLANMDIKDLSISALSLEEMFIDYYKEEHLDN